MANIRLKKGQVDPKNPHSTSVAGPATLKTVDITSVSIESQRKAAEEASVADLDYLTSWQSYVLSEPELNAIIGVQDTVSFRNREEEQAALDAETAVILPASEWTRQRPNNTWITPNPQHGEPQCVCGNPMELREMNNGLQTWVHAGRPELNLYSRRDSYGNEDETYYINPTGESSEEFKVDENLEILELNARLGVGLASGTVSWDGMRNYPWTEAYERDNVHLESQFNTSGYANQYNFKDFMPRDESIGRHNAVFAESCNNCGNQVSTVSRKLFGGAVRKCVNCKNTLGFSQPR